jgi:hypothetical protein
MGSPATDLLISDQARAHRRSPETLAGRYCADDEPTTFLPKVTSHPPLAWSQWEPPAASVTVDPAATTDTAQSEAGQDGLGERAARIWQRLMACV